MSHRLCSTDPISLHDIPDLEGMPYVVVGDKHDDLTIYFESEENRQTYLDIPLECPGNDFSINLNSPEVEGIDNG